jgi:hypothetical protein
MIYCMLDASYTAWCTWRNEHGKPDIQFVPAETHRLMASLCVVKMGLLPSGVLGPLSCINT